MSRRIVGPFNRVVGDLEVQLQIDDGRVCDAWVVSPLYRGFEQMLQGKDPLDALVYVPRICGICSVSQSVATANALADVQGLIPPRNGELTANLILANENLADHLTHFYLFFEPLAKLSLVGGQISNSHPVDANEYCSCILPKLVALFFSNHGGNRKFSARGSTTRVVWRVFQDGSGS